MRLVLAGLLAVGLAVPVSAQAWCADCWRSGPYGWQGAAFIWVFIPGADPGKGDCVWSGPLTCQPNDPCNFTWQLIVASPYASVRACVQPFGPCVDIKTDPIPPGPIVPPGHFGFTWDATNAPLICGASFLFSLEGYSVGPPAAWIVLGNISGACSVCPLSDH